MSGRVLRIAVLDCDTPVPNVHYWRGLYSDIFAKLLRDAAAQVKDLADLDVRRSRYDCMLGDLPTEEDLAETDAVIITGSSASAYDPVPWVISLTEFIKTLYTSHPRIKIFGSCFGHQLLCNALFAFPGQSVVERDPNGWELGVHPITLTPTFLSHFGSVTSNPSHPSQLRLQFVHADHVVLPMLPPGFEIVGSSQHCVLQGIWKRGRVLTYQGHAEFDRFVNAETLKVFGKPIWSDGFMKEALRAVDRDDDAMWAAGVILRFLMDEVMDSEILASELGVMGEEEVMARL